MERGATPHAVTVPNSQLHRTQGPCVSSRCATLLARPVPVIVRPSNVEEKRSEVHVSVLKTKPTAVSAESHIAAISNEEQRSDARTLVALMRRVTGQKPRMWGPSIVGFGRYHYKYASGHEGDSAIAAFAARGRELVVYIAEDFEDRDDLLARLGKHKLGKVCLYIRRLSDVDLKVLETLVVRSVADTNRRYPQTNA